MDFKRLCAGTWGKVLDGQALETESAMERESRRVRGTDASQSHFGSASISHLQGPHLVVQSCGQSILSFFVETLATKAVNRQ